MITKHDHIRRQTCADTTITDVIRKALADNFERIPFTHEGGFIATDLGETESDEDLHITISGHQENGGPMYQNITVIYFDTKEKADRFRYSPEGVGFDDPYGDGQDSFDLTVLAGDPRLPGLIATILKNYFGFTDRSRLCAHTYCEVDYFRKDPADARPQQMKS